MAFDGITVRALVHELNQTLIDGRINKIAQPEQDELLFTIKNNKQQYRLLISAGASLPLVYLTDINKPSPMTAPNFCMLLRKHISGGRITAITQPGLERIIHFEIEHLNELGDLCHKTLIVELMGKHSNIIFCEGTKIIDSIKHVNFQLSSVREVLPGREYFIPTGEDKLDPFTLTESDFSKTVYQKPMPLAKAIYTSITGISPIIAEDFLFVSGLDSAKIANALSDEERIHCYHSFIRYMDDVSENHFAPVIYYEKDIPKEFCAIPLELFHNNKVKHFESISEVLATYYSEKNAATRIKQRSTDLRQIVSTALSKNYKKYDLQEKQMSDTQKREKYRLYGELLTTYGYLAAPGSDSLTCTNYYDNSEITIPLDKELTAIENAKHYFEKYSKQKRTYEALTDIILATKKEIEHLETISTALDLAANENELKAIREELIDYGYIRRKSSEKKSRFVNKPLCYKVDDSTNIYIGKNNYQNEEVTFSIATGNDWWFHAKNVPGSHVVVKSSKAEIEDHVFEIAGSIAAYFSKNRNSDKVEIDYIQKKHVKRVSGAAPGFVIYHTNYSLMAAPGSPESFGLLPVNS